MPIQEIKKEITSVGEPLKELKQEGTAIRKDFLNTTQAAVTEVKAPLSTTANGSAEPAQRPYKPNSSGEAATE